MRLGLFFLLLGVMHAKTPETIDLWPEGVPGLKADAGPERKESGGRVSNIHHPSLTVMRPNGQPNGTAVIVCPGGGYVREAFDHEGVGAPSAWLNGLGVTAFVLKYRQKEYGAPAPLQDFLRAVRTVRSRAAEFHLNPDRIGALGFSAGGHLAASGGTLFDLAEARTGSPLDAVSGRPDFLLLIYPVITMRSPYAHEGSVHALLGPHPSEGQLARWSVDEQVSARTPPSFLVSTEEDHTVPMQNSILFYEAMKRAKVPGELLIFEKGPHGFGLAQGLGPTSEWPRRAAEWMRAHGWVE
jgi:acetyl esterase/lipase